MQAYRGWALTGGTVIDEGSQGFAVPPVTVEVGDGQLGHLVLNPAQQALFGGLLLHVLVLLIVPHGHGDGVVKDESPDETQDQLQIPVHNGFAICG